MATLTNWALDWAERRMSRRGFLAACGKVTLAAGAAMAGLAVLPEKAHAFCCPGSSCTGCPGGATPGCPTGCIQAAPVGQCCENNVVQHCYPCDCGSGGIDCFCQYATVTAC